ncbi:type I methionyl aminopeptidase [Maribrevibacterium harenarium]|uniref:Methionine aminopeptidase n=1 Tax=Maribrevibacterium harenarium TaxID=2589817 RepID=A0A501WVR7_9GAMM|nr:type I methionyl aminopeptidase [Maribrevibacterium harenarium]TPE52832.1 type I methionyl aminopeptidase [Maribrevibacterium harenarium]
MSNEILERVALLTQNGRAEVPAWTPRPAATRFTDINDINGMREAGRLAAEVLTMLAEYVVPGVTTEQLDIIAHNHIVTSQGAIPAPLNYHGFPKSCCTSVNDVICHGIPNDKALKKGDVVNIDITVIKDGYYGDTSKMFFVGDVAPHAKRLCQVTQECLYLAIKMVKPGVRLGDIGAAISAHAHKNHYSVVEEYCGHGLGTTFHGEPQVAHYGRAGTGVVLEEGMTFTIEPMINAGKKQVKHTGPDNWIAKTKDGRLSAQYEHSLLVTADGVEILTLRPEETI